MNNKTILDNNNIKNILEHNKFNNLNNDIKSTFFEILQNCNTEVSLTTTSGLGDVLLHKIYKIYKNDTSIIYWNIKHLLDIRPFPENIINIVFIYNLFLKLFKKNFQVCYNEGKYNFITINWIEFSKIDTYDLSSFFNFKLDDHTILNKNEYIIIHTKIAYFKKENVDFIKQNLFDYFKNKKFKVPVIIVGERNISINSCSKNVYMSTIYNEALYLKNNNFVIDLTVNELYNIPNINKFKEDVNLINNAKLNIGFGWGGQFCINIAFSSNTIYFINERPPGIPDIKINKKNFIIVDNLELLFINLNKY